MGRSSAAATRAFRPSAIASLVLLPLAALFVVLGHWQQGRAAEKSARTEAFRNAPRLTALPARSDPGAFTRVTLSGRFDPSRHVLVDNQVLSGRPGVHVLTPFRVAAPESGGALVLVNRGWLSQGPDRSTLPEIPVAPGAAGEVTISGHLAPLVAPGMRLGDPAPLPPGPWPQRAVFPRMDDIAAALGEAPYPLALYLDAASPGGFDGRDWQPVNMGPGRHKAYALQWYALAATAIAAWIVTAMRGRART